MDYFKQPLSATINVHNNSFNVGVQYDSMSKYDRVHLPNIILLNFQAVFWYQHNIQVSRYFDQTTFL